MNELEWNGTNFSKKMDNIYNITGIFFDNEYMIIRIDDNALKVRISEASYKLANASEQERNYYKISLSGYGIHWEKLDEDLSVNRLMKLTGIGISSTLTGYSIKK